jgi:hypothetical protein
LRLLGAGFVSRHRSAGTGCRGAADTGEVAGDDVGVDPVGAWAVVAEELLNVTEVCAGLEEVGGEAVAEGVDGELLGDSGAEAGALEDFLEGAGGKVAAGSATGEEPAFGSFEVHAGADDRGGSIGEDGIAVLAALAGADAEEASVVVEVAGAEADDFADAEAGGVDEHEGGPVLDVADGGEDAADFVAAEDGGEAAVLAGLGEREGEVNAEDVVSEESEGADGLSVVGGGASLDGEDMAARVLGAAGVRGVGQGGQESADVAEVELARARAVSAKQELVGGAGAALGRRTVTGTTGRSARFSRGACFAGSRPRSPRRLPCGTSAARLPPSRRPRARSRTAQPPWSRVAARSRTPPTP